MDMYLPTLLEITDLPAAADLVTWQEVVTVYLKSVSQTTIQTFWYNTELTGLTTDTARELVAIANYGSFDTVQHHVIVAAETTNITAQNALLKTLEEPPQGFHLVLAVRHTTNILPTIISRCKHAYWQTNVSDSTPSQPTPSLISKALDVRVSPGELITNLQAYKDRADALALVESELIALQNTAQPPSPQVLKATLHCWQALQQNANVGLALEEWLFSVRSSHLTR